MGRGEREKGNQYLNRTQKMELSLKLKKAQEFILRDDERESFVYDYRDLELLRNILLLRKKVTIDEAESFHGIMNWILRNK